MSAESVRIINAAISRVQGNTISSVDDGSVEAILASLNYEQWVETALIENPWKFARKEDDCVLVPGTPTDQNYSYEWTLPSDVLKLRTVTVDGTPIDYKIVDDDTILTNYAQDVVAVYTYRASEDVWPADFTEGLTLRIEAAYLRADERVTQAAEREQAAGRRMAQARLTHSQEEATRSHTGKPLITVRRTGSAPVRR